jgi:hypothetical protein
MAAIPGSCYYTSWTGGAFAITQLVSWIVPLALAVASPVHVYRELAPTKRDGEPRIVDRWGRQFVLVAFGMYIFFWSFALYIFQVALAMVRPDPFCPAVLTYGLPSSSAFYVAASGTFMVCMAVAMRFWYNWTNTLYLLVWWFVLPAVLIWVGYNTWQEVLLSASLGGAATVVFFFAVWKLAINDMPYLLQQPPWSWFNCVDTWVQSQAQQDQSEELRLWLQDRDRKYGNLGCFLW